MIMVPPAPWKTATTRSLIVAAVITAIVMGAFAYMVKRVFSDANHPVTEEQKEQFWRNLEEVARQQRQTEQSRPSDRASQTPR
jgi:hypothetical protein